MFLIQTLLVLAGVVGFLGWSYLIIEIAKDAFADHDYRPSAIQIVEKPAHMRQNRIRSTYRTGFVH